MSIILVTDTSCDMDLAEFTEKQIVCIPLPVTFGETAYNIMEKNLFWEKLTSSGIYPKTSQPSPETFLELFSSAKKHGDTIIAILLSSALSGTFHSAVLAKNIVDYESIYLIDSLSATAAVKLLVDQAVIMRNAGVPAEEIVKKLEDLKLRIHVFAVMDTLEYLYKGGRLTKTQAGLGSLANLKPLITLNEEGAVHVIGKSIGRNLASQALLKEIQSHTPDPDYPFLLIYSHTPEHCKNFEIKLHKYIPSITPDTMINIGATIGSHIGPGSFGVVYVEKSSVSHSS